MRYSSDLTLVLSEPSCSDIPTAKISMPISKFEKPKFMLEIMHRSVRYATMFGKVRNCA